MKAADIITGLQIIERARPANESGYHVRAEHDEIFAGSLSWNLTDVDRQRLQELGWDADEGVDGWRCSV